VDHDAVQGLVDIEEIKRLKARYLRYLDTQDWDAWSDVFTDDVDFQHDAQLVDPDGTQGGRSTLVQFVSRNLEGATTVHQAYSPDITLTGPDTATGIWGLADYVSFAGEEPPKGFRGYGHYHEEYVRTRKGWRIKRVAITRLRIDALDGGFPAVS
jgi:hypothetical protein